MSKIGIIILKFHKFSTIVPIIVKIELERSLLEPNQYYNTENGS